MSDSEDLNRPEEYGKHFVSFRNAKSTGLLSEGMYSAEVAEVKLLRKQGADTYYYRLYFDVAEEGGLTTRVDSVISFAPGSDGQGFDRAWERLSTLLGEVVPREEDFDLVMGCERLKGRLCRLKIRPERDEFRGGEKNVVKWISPPLPGVTSTPVASDGVRPKKPSLF